MARPKIWTDEMITLLRQLDEQKIKPKRIARLLAETIGRHVSAGSVESALYVYSRPPPEVPVQPPVRHDWGWDFSGQCIEPGDNVIGAYRQAGVAHLLEGEGE